MEIPETAVRLMATFLGDVEDLDPASVRFGLTCRAAYQVLNRPMRKRAASSCTYTNGLKLLDLSRKSSLAEEEATQWRQVASTMADVAAAMRAAQHVVRRLLSWHDQKNPDELKSMGVTSPFELANEVTRLMDTVEVVDRKTARSSEHKKSVADWLAVCVDHAKWTKETEVADFIGGLCEPLTTLRTEYPELDVFIDNFNETFRGGATESEDEN